MDEDSQGTVKEFRVNDYLTLKLEGGRTMIYVGGKRFLHCKRLVINVPLEELAYYESIDSIDEAAEHYATVYDGKGVGEQAQDIFIPPETEFLGHCSNLQAWYENGYDTRILRSNLAFPLLRALAKAGDQAAINAFRGEIISRLKSGFSPVITFLIEEEYIRYLSREDIMENNVNLEDFKELLKFNGYGHYAMKKVEYNNFTKGRPYLFIRGKPVFVDDSVLDLSRLGLKSYSEVDGLFNFKSLDEYLRDENTHSIKKLKLYNNKIDILPRSILNLENLEELDLERNELSVIPDHVGSLRELKTFNAKYNHISIISKEIGNLTSLEVLSLGCNQIEVLPASIGNLSSLKRFYGFNNQLRQIPSTFEKLHHLHFLMLNSNLLKSIPDCFYKLQSLFRIELNGNQLKSIPRSLTTLKSLNIFELDNNLLEFLPDDIGDLQSLVWLSLSNNHLEILPDSITKLQLTKILDIRGNPKLQLTPKQNDWIRDLQKEGCRIKK